MTLQRNEGSLDRAIRLVAGIVLLPVGLFLLDGLQGETVGVIVAVAVVLVLLTGASGVCLMYLPFGISTLRRNPVSASH